jgi:two-component system heavy metal sensor histidine kinase CusS
VTVSITPIEEDLAVTIDNDGEAIAPDVLPFLFERFFRADKSRARPESDGAGLGLAITKAIVLAHGGTISATRVHDRTRFTVRLPIRC